MIERQIKDSYENYGMLLNQIIFLALRQSSDSISFAANFVICRNLKKLKGGTNISVEFNADEDNEWLPRPNMFVSAADDLFILCLIKTIPELEHK